MRRGCGEDFEIKVLVGGARGTLRRGCGEGFEFNEFKVLAGMGLASLARRENARRAFCKSRREAMR